jgi:hypothetical protein
MPSGRSATSDVPDRRGEVGDEAVVTSEGLSSRLAFVVVGSAAMAASDDRALELFQATWRSLRSSGRQFDQARCGWPTVNASRVAGR